MKLGDRIADTIHKVTGADPCESCKRRQQWLNDLGDWVMQQFPGFASESQRDGENENDGRNKK
jgi:hypothetical protein